MNCLLPHDFITSCVRQLENIGLLSYVDLPIIDTSHYTIPNTQYQKVTFVHITTNLSEKSFRDGKLSSLLWYKFSELQHFN